MRRKPVHLRLPGRNKGQFSCGVQGNIKRTPTMVITSTLSARAVTCVNCKRTDAYKKAAT